MSMDELTMCVFNAIMDTLEFFVKEILPYALAFALGWGLLYGLAVAR